MKGPSLDAIRKFKQQQELKKREEDYRKVQDKLSTLEHRAAQGDRKAKVQLKKIEQIKETAQNGNKQLDETKLAHSGQRGLRQPNGNPSLSTRNSNGVQQTKSKPKSAETDFEELMRLAKSNTNEVKTQEKPKDKDKDVRRIPKRPIETAKTVQPPPTTTSKKVIAPERSVQIAQVRPGSGPRVEPMIRPNLGPKPRPSTSTNAPYRPEQHVRSTQHPRFQPRPPIRHDRYDDEYDEYDEEEDEYESDGFVVDEVEDEAQEELRKTLKDVFRYDRRRADLKEQELDRQYRAIGRVSTFEDLEREERRASKLAAAEDAKELRAEEERKRLKKIRLKGSRN
jgi:anti-sigma28 factor (negative regulator of flagellin synthesis)